MSLSNTISVLSPIVIFIVIIASRGRCYGPMTAARVSEVICYISVEKNLNLVF